MADAGDIFLRKAQECLSGATSEAAQGRFNNSANRCYYACFLAAIAALIRAGINPPGAKSVWSHTFVPSQFVGQLVNRRKAYPTALRDTLPRAYLLRQTADYGDDDVTRMEAERMLRRTREFVEAVIQRW